MITEQLFKDLDQTTIKSLTELLDELKKDDINLYNKLVPKLNEDGIKELDSFINTLMQMYVIVLYFDESAEIKINKFILVNTLKSLIKKDDIYKELINYYISNVSVRDFQSESVPESFYEKKEKELKELIKLLD